MKGLLDLSYVGVIIELSTVIDERHYGTDGIPPVELAEQQFARESYLDFVQQYSKKYVLVSTGPLNEGQVAEPKAAFFDMQLVKTAAHLILYKNALPQFDAACQPAQLLEAINEYICQHHPETLPLFKELLAGPMCQVTNLNTMTFRYQGENFEVQKRTGSEEVAESLTFKVPKSYSSAMDIDSNEDRDAESSDSQDDDEDAYATKKNVPKTVSGRAVSKRAATGKFNFLPNTRPSLIHCKVDAGTQSNARPAKKVRR
jgi:hypothetical protein